MVTQGAEFRRETFPISTIGKSVDKDVLKVQTNFPSEHFKSNFYIVSLLKIKFLLSSFNSNQLVIYDTMLARAEN